MRRNKGVVLLSGGADSATLLYLALTQCEELHAISVNYGQRHKKELECAKILCAELDIPHKVIDFDLTAFGGSPLTDSTLDVPKQSDDNQALTVVPFRNTFLTVLAAAYAKQHGLNTIYCGPTYEDLANYEDCREIFIESLQQTLRLGGTVHDLRILAPFINSRKTDIVYLGVDKLSVPYENTWTCYEGKDEPCLECDACKERIESFVLNGFRDPLIKDDAVWDTLKIQFQFQNPI